MRRRLAAGALVVAALLAVPAGSSFTAAQARAGSTANTAHTGIGVPVVHLQMRCHTPGDHTPIG